MVWLPRCTFDISSSGFKGRLSHLVHSARHKWMILHLQTNHSIKMLSLLGDDDDGTIITTIFNHWTQSSSFLTTAKIKPPLIFTSLSSPTTHLSAPPLLFVHISLTPSLTPSHLTACWVLRCLIHACTVCQPANMLFCSLTAVGRGSAARAL